MLTIGDAFKKFKSRLELNDREQADASRQQQEIRAHMDTKFQIDTDFLTGSYKRWTKTKPLKDVDIFCVLGSDERHYRSKPPSVLPLLRAKQVVAELAELKAWRKQVAEAAGFKCPYEEVPARLAKINGNVAACHFPSSVVYLEREASGHPPHFVTRGGRRYRRTIEADGYVYLQVRP